MSHIPSLQIPQLYCRNHPNQLVLKICLENSCRDRNQWILCKFCVEDHKATSCFLSNTVDAKQLLTSTYISDIIQDTQERIESHKTNIDGFYTNLEDSIFQLLTYIQSQRQEYQRQISLAGMKKLDCYKTMENKAKTLQKKYFEGDMSNENFISKLLTLHESTANHSNSYIDSESVFQALSQRILDVQEEFKQFFNFQIQPVKNEYQKILKINKLSARSGRNNLHNMYYDYYPYTKQSYLEIDNQRKIIIIKELKELQIFNTNKKFLKKWIINKSSGVKQILKLKANTLLELNEYGITEWNIYGGKVRYIQDKDYNAQRQIFELPGRKIILQSLALNITVWNLDLAEKEYFQKDSDFSYFANPVLTEDDKFLVFGHGNTIMHYNLTTQLKIKKAISNSDDSRFTELIKLAWMPERSVLVSLNANQTIKFWKYVQLKDSICVKVISFQMNIKNKRLPSLNANGNYNYWWERKSSKPVSVSYGRLQGNLVPTVFNTDGATDRIKLLDLDDEVYLLDKRLKYGVIFQYESKSRAVIFTRLNSVDE